jgi:hypothetical protein
MADDDRERLAGGNMGVVVRVGDTVARQAGDWTPSVHRLLNHLEAYDVPGVPRVQGRTSDGREVLSFLPGTVPSWPLPAWLWHEEALASGARLLRRIHDASAGADRTGPWRSPVHEPQEVVCHNDFATYNLVFDDDGMAVGAIDWDFASPGPRLWDLAYLAYRIVPMTTVDEGDGLTADERRQRLDLLLREYGTDASPHELAQVLHDRLLELADFSDRMADELGRPELRDHAVQYRRDAAALPKAWLGLRRSGPGGACAAGR